MAKAAVSTQTGNVIDGSAQTFAPGADVLGQHSPQLLRSLLYGGAATLAPAKETGSRP
ncbi:hypothetical protein [Nonomuraea endophytica]|uniref:Uncharacterized protein n=1 Tax=Nonomuraea endophytica TaxID=714136 RepID=A0A7W8A6Z0_9ACTN|nr:hypothetical protein [Nonomuraea endophytica]MBB5079776.1 hypothetical protein [Nonomuraea endophytica]